MGFLLDTNVPSELTRQKPDVRVRAWVDGHDALHISTISIGEVHHGVWLLADGRKRRQIEDKWDYVLLPLFGDRILPVTKSIAERWGEISAERRLTGRPINPPDGLIAATALEHGLTLITRNVKDFVGLGLEIVNPWDAV